MADAGTEISFSVRVRDSGDLYADCDIRVVLTSSELSNLPVFVNPPDEDTTYRIPEVSDLAIEFKVKAGGLMNTIIHPHRLNGFRVHHLTPP